MLFNTCMRLIESFYIILHSDIKSKVLCSVRILLQLIIIIHEDVKYRNIIEKYAVSVSDICDTDTLKLIRYPILRVLGIGFVPSLVKSYSMNIVYSVTFIPPYMPFTYSHVYLHFIPIIRELLLSFQYYFKIYANVYCK